MLQRTSRSNPRLDTRAWNFVSLKYPASRSVSRYERYVPGYTWVLLSYLGRYEELMHCGLEEQPLCQWHDLRTAVCLWEILLLRLLHTAI